MILPRLSMAAVLVVTARQIGSYVRASTWFGGRPKPTPEASIPRVSDQNVKFWLMVLFVSLLSVIALVVSTVT